MYPIQCLVALLLAINALSGVGAVPVKTSCQNCTSNEKCTAFTAYDASISAMRTSHSCRDFVTGVIRAATPRTSWFGGKSSTTGNGATTNKPSSGGIIGQINPFGPGGRLSSVVPAVGKMSTYVSPASYLPSMSKVSSFVPTMSNYVPSVPSVNNIGSFASLTSLNPWGRGKKTS